MLRARLRIWEAAKNQQYYAARSLIAAAGSKSPKAIDREDVAAACAAQLRHPSQFTRSTRMKAMRTLLTLLREEYGAPRLQQHVPRVPKPAPRNITATDTERSQIMAAAPPYLRVWLLLCSDLAMRSGTAARIAPINYDEERRELSFTTKFGTAQTLPVTDALADLFAMAQGGDARTPYTMLLPRMPRYGCTRPMPPRRTNSKHHVTHLRKQFRKLLAEQGISKPLRPHDLRRTTAVRTLEACGDLRLVQALLGHRELATTLYYLDHRNTPVSRAVLETAKLNERKKQ